MSEQPNETVFTIRNLNARIRDVVERGFTDGNTLVKGTALDVKTSAQGHVYFDLEDNRQTIRCFFPRSNAQKIGWTVQKRMKVQVVGRISFYEQTGEAQIVVTQIELLRRAPHTDFRHIERHLSKLGLWPKRKKKLPNEILNIAVISGSDSEAIKDFQENYAREGGKANVVYKSVSLSGENAPREIAEMINQLNLEADIDVIVLARGGGRSVEINIFDDLLIAEAICRSSIPIMTAIGHASHKTVADHVADFSVTTPTEAAIQLARHETRSEKTTVSSMLIIFGIIIAIAVVVILLLLTSG